MRQALTFVLERLRPVSSLFDTEPLEVAWAEVAILFVQIHESRSVGDFTVTPQLSADGINWVDEGTEWVFPIEPGVQYLRLRDFGGWLRFRCALPDSAETTLTIQIQLKE